MARQLLGLWQGIQSVTEFSIKFHIKAAEIGWEDSALRSAFVNGLSQSMKEELSTRNEPDGFKDLAIRIDNRLHERESLSREGKRKQFCVGGGEILMRR